MKILCDYVNDWGLEFKRVEPRLVGINKTTNEALTYQQVISTVSNLVPTDGYYEVGDKDAVCPIWGRMRKILIELPTVKVQLDYYQPFTVLNWGNFTEAGIKVEVFPERIADETLELLLRKANG